MDGGVHAPPEAPLFDRAFYISTLGSRCLDLGPRDQQQIGSPVVIRACNQNESQRIRVKEIDSASHDIWLIAQSVQLCLGIVGNAGPSLSVGQRLELQTCTGSGAQRFAFDGDALLVGKQSDGSRVSRDFVIELLFANTNQGTPVATGHRDFSDAEFWQMHAVDGTDSRPTTGFVRVTNNSQYDLALTHAGWGTVIELQPIGGTLTLERTTHNRFLKSGATLRGGRKFMSRGAELYLPLGVISEHDSFAIGLENHARITGLRLRGPDEPLRVFGVIAQKQLTPGFEELTNVIADHLEVSRWDSAVLVDDLRPGATTCTERPDPTPVVKVAASFIHHNFHYGVVVGGGGSSHVSRTLMYQSQHDVTHDGHAANIYVVSDGLFTSESDDDQNHVIDLHGTCLPGAVGGVAGDLVDVGWSTFLSGRDNMNVRGTPCRLAFFHHNVTTSSLDDALDMSIHGENSSCEPEAGDPAQILVEDFNEFGYDDPTRTYDVGDFGVGDFDGDAIDDVFLGTGVTWWYSPGGRLEWRFLNRMPERASSLRFGDFDADGRTDVIAVHGSSIDVSWAGGSPWNHLIDTTQPLSDLAVGQFDDDPRADLFVSNGADWNLASGGTTWTEFATSEFRTPDLRFGDFNGDGKTDVFRIVGDEWQIVPSPSNSWDELGPARSTEIEYLVVADFDGDGFADVGEQKLTFPIRWRISSGGTSSYEILREAPPPQWLTLLPIGRFNLQNGADVLFWDDLRFNIAAGGKDVMPWSLQSMR